MKSLNRNGVVQSQTSLPTKLGATRLREEFNQHLLIKSPLNLAGFVAQTFGVQFPYVHGFRNSAAVKITRAVCPHRPPVALDPMVFTMQNLYLEAGDKQGKRAGLNENSNVLKKAKKAPSAASLVP